MNFCLNDYITFMSSQLCQSIIFYLNIYNYEVKIMKILLFGSTGMLGNYVHRLLRHHYEIINIIRNDYDIGTDSWEKLENIIQKHLNENDIIINCAGIIPQKYKNCEYKLYIKINTLFPHKVEELSLKYHLRFIHITTDCVYDGSKGNYDENDVHTANDLYGISKSLGEPERSTIIRTSIIGEEERGKKSLIEWIKSNKNGKINGYVNHFWNGVTCLELAKFILKMIDTNHFWVGVRHIYSPSPVSKYELCCYVNEIFQLNILVEKYRDTLSKNMTLQSIHPSFIHTSIYHQIMELLHFTRSLKT